MYKTDVPLVTVDNSKREVLVRCPKFQLRASYELLQAIFATLVVAYQDEQFEHCIVENTPTDIAPIVLVNNGTLDHETPVGEHMLLFAGVKCSECSHDLLVDETGRRYCYNGCFVLDQQDTDENEQHLEPEELPITLHNASIMEQIVVVIKTLHSKFGLTQPEHIVPIVWPMLDRFLEDASMIEMLELDSYPTHQVGLLDFVHTAMVQAGVLHPVTLLPEVSHDITTDFHVGDTLQTTLISGKTHTGKTLKLFSLVTAHWNKDMHITICDIHSLKDGSITRRLQDIQLANAVYAVSHTQIINAMETFKQELQHRKDSTNDTWPVSLLVVDDYSNIMLDLPSNLQILVRQCEQEGRQYNMYCFVASQSGRF